MQFYHYMNFVYPRGCRIMHLVRQPQFCPYISFLFYQHPPPIESRQAQSVMIRLLPRYTLWRTETGEYLTDQLSVSS